MVGPSIGSVCPCKFEPREREILTRPVLVETHALGSSSTALGEMVDMDTTWYTGPQVPNIAAYLEPLLGGLKVNLWIDLSEKGIDLLARTAKFTEDRSVIVRVVMAPLYS